MTLIVIARRPTWYLLTLVSMLFYSSCYDKNARVTDQDSRVSSHHSAPVDQGDQSAPFSKTLRQWTEEILNFDEARIAAPVSLPEYRNLLKEHKISLAEIDHALKLFAKVMVKGPITNEEHWINQKLPDASFYHIADLGKQVESDTADQIYYGQKVLFPSESSIVIMGDFHGSVHSLIRNLWRLKYRGIIDDNFKIIKNNVYMVFTGDFVDRGRYSVETLYTLIRLKIANVQNVYLVRGNHENRSISEAYGLPDELLAKYGQEAGIRLFKDITDLYRFFPVVLFVGDDTASPKYMHFSHGGFSYDAQKKQLLHSPAPLLKSSKIPHYELIEAPFYQGYMWADFLQQDESESNNNRGFSDPNQGVALIGNNATTLYLENADPKKELIAIFRGHQDREFGLKLLFKNMPDQNTMQDLAQKNRMYSLGPFNWRDVLGVPADLTIKNNIPLGDYRRVFTFTTAAEGQGVPYDCYGIITMGNTLEDFRLEIHDNPLTGRTLARSYVTIAPAEEPKDDGIHVSWSESGPGRLLIP